MKSLQILLLSMSLSFYPSIDVLAEPHSPSFFKKERQSFVRGETAEWKLQATPGAEVIFSVNGFFTRNVTADAEGVARFPIDTSALKTGSYQLAATTGGKTCRVKFYIGPMQKRHSIPIYRWGHVSEEMDIEWYRARGLTGGTIGVMRDPEARGSRAYEARMRLLDRAVREGFAIGFYLHPLWSPSLIQEESARVLGKDGKRQSAETAWPVDPLTDAAKAHAEKVSDSFCELYASHPAIHYLMLSSEQRTLAGQSPELLELARKELPFDFSEILAPSGPGFVKAAKEGRGIIPDDDPMYLGFKWFHERGHGTTPLNGAMAAKIRQQRADLTLSHEPWRNAPTKDVARGLDLVGSWTYAASDLRRLLFLEFLRAPGRHENQKVEAILTLYLYAHMVMPLENSRADLVLDTSAGDPFFTASPDYVREALWIYLSQRPDEFSIYWASRLPPDDPKLDPHLTAPETFDVFREFTERVLTPFGPAILACRPAKAKVALLASAAGCWFTRQELGFNINEAALPYAHLLSANNVPFQVLLDDDIVEGRLDQFEALVMPQAETMTETMARKIGEFIAAGGTVIANHECALADEKIILTAFDFAPLNRQSGLAAGKPGGIVTAEEARAMMEGYAARLAPLVGKYRGEATSASQRVIINSLESEGGAYHFIINDDRTYGPRFGQYKLHFEDGVRQVAPVRFDGSRYPVLYDLVSRRRLEAGKEGEISMALPAAGGRIVLALPEEVGELRVFAPAKIAIGKREQIRLQLLGQSSTPMRHAHPVHVKITDGRGIETEWSGTTAIMGGSVEVPFVPAWNDEAGVWRIEVTDLVTDRKVKSQMELVE